MILLWVHKEINELFKYKHFLGNILTICRVSMVCSQRGGLSLSVHVHDTCSPYQTCTKGLFTWRWGTPCRWPLGGVTNLSIQSLFFSWLLSREKWGTSPRQVARSAVPGNPLRWGKFSPCECWRLGGLMFSWAFIHYKTNWKADRCTKIRPCLV